MIDFKRIPIQRFQLNTSEPVVLLRPVYRTIDFQRIFSLLARSLIGLYNGRQYNLNQYIYCLLADNDDGCCFSFLCSFLSPLIIWSSRFFLCLHRPRPFSVRALTIYVMCYVFPFPFYVWFLRLLQSSKTRPRNR